MIVTWSDGYVACPTISNTLHSVDYELYVLIIKYKVFNPIKGTSFEMDVYYWPCI